MSIFGFVRISTNPRLFIRPLAAHAIENQATLCSNDSDFGRFPGLRWENPLRQ